LLGNFSFGLINFINLSTAFFIQRFLTLLIYFILGVNVFLHLWETERDFALLAQLFPSFNGLISRPVFEAWVPFSTLLSRLKSNPNLT